MHRSKLPALQWLIYIEDGWMEPAKKEEAVLVKPGNLNKNTKKARCEGWDVGHLITVNEEGREKVKEGQALASREQLGGLSKELSGQKE